MNICCSTHRPAAPAASAAPAVAVRLLPQDTMVATPEDVLLPAEQLGEKLQGSRLRTRDSFALAQADAQGNYRPEVGTPQFDQVNAHGVVAGILLTYERYTGKSIPWSFPGRMEVRPHAGEGKTAYYSRWDQSVNFCQWDSPSLGKTVKTAESFDVASHEAGHAILDGLRPGLLSGRESKAFHEAFGDCSALMHALQYDSNLERILAENGGDFSKPSLITRLAEEFGSAYNKEDDNPNNDDRPYYRSALNDFKYQPIDSLPSDSYPPTQPEEVLTSEPHSFSRIWSGAFYQMLGSIYQQEAGKEASLEALKTAREALSTMWGRSLDLLPSRNLKFPQVAEAMLKEARAYEGGRYAEAISGVLADRQLLASSPTRPMVTPGPWKSETVQVGSQGRQVFTFEAPQQVEVDLGSAGRAQMQLASGLTVVVDENGDCLDVVYSPLTQGDLADAQKEARLAAEQARPGARLLPAPAGQNELPQFEWIPRWECFGH